MLIFAYEPVVSECLEFNVILIQIRRSRQLSASGQIFQTHTMLVTMFTCVRHRRLYLYCRHRLCYHHRDRH